MYKCKQCEFMSITKEENWTHQRVHIKPERLLECPKCPFVTEYKHHLDYHLRNHLGSKPFKCSLCDYQCVNQSMLRSHLKSHTKGVPYHCNDCTYSSKYHTSLKTHLEKFNHKEAIGSPRISTSPLPILDTIQLPSSSSSSVSSSSSIKPIKDDYESSFSADKTNINDNLQNEKLISNALPYATYFPYLAAAAALVATNHQQQYNQIDDSVIAAATVATLLTNLTTQQLPLQQQQQQQQEQQSASSSSFIDINNNRVAKTILNCDQCKFKTTNKRDLKIHKRNDHKIKIKNESKLKTPNQVQQTLSSTTQQTVPLNEVINNQENTNLKSTLSFMHECNYCNILFKDFNLFNLHQQFHGDSPQDAFKCTKCGIKLNNKYDFNLHIIKQSHLNDINICNN